MVKIYEVTENSKAASAGIQPGDTLVSVNGNEIEDVLDYNFYMASRRVELVLMRGGERYEVKLLKRTYDDIGLNFESFLMDEKHSCRNKCIFCFIDQLPRGMRDTLYFKDDDSRMSFLSGSYITLTNLSEHDIDRIVKMKTSPINISVHATNPELRVMMMKNKNAGKVLEIMRRFADANITMNCQIVLCRSVNDGAELDRSMRDLAALYPAVASVSIVPAGLTKFRDGLYPLEPFTPDECAAVIRQVEGFANECLEKHGCRIFACGDEMYIKAGLTLPSADNYEGYPQIENGVGMMTSMADEVDEAIEDIDFSEFSPDVRRTVSIATGVAAYDYIRGLCDKLTAKCPGLDVKVYRIINNFFGENITVAGLLTGTDLAAQLDGKELGSRLMLSSTMLRYDGEVFLDDMTPSQLSEKLGVPIVFNECDGREFAEAILKI